MDYTKKYNLNNIFLNFLIENKNLQNINVNNNDLLYVNDIISLYSSIINEFRKLYIDTYYEYKIYDKQNNEKICNDCYQVKGEKMIIFVNLINKIINDKMNDKIFRNKYIEEINFIFSQNALLKNKNQYILPNIIMESWHSLYLIFLIK